jgi:hypothetical protein
VFVRPLVVSVKPVGGLEAFLIVRDRPIRALVPHETVLLQSRENRSELPCPTALGATRPSLLGTGLPGSVSELASNVDTAVPDSVGDFPSWVVRSVPLLPDGHSATTDGARFLSRLNTVRSAVCIVLPTVKHRVVNMLVKVCEQTMTALCPRPTPSLRSGVENGGLVPVFC